MVMLWRLPILPLSLLCSACGTEPNYEGTVSSFEGTTLPVVVVDTSNRRVLDDPKVSATLRLYETGLADLAEIDTRSADLEGSIGIEIRGHTSKEVPKKQYGVEFRDAQGNDRDVELLGMPTEADWVLAAPFADKSLLRNTFAFALSRSMGRYAPRTAFAELFLNDDGASAVGTEHYRGVYVVTEKIKRGKDRVDFEALDDTSSDLSGGYLLEWTLRERLDESSRWILTPSGAALDILYPKPDDLTPAAQRWISEYVANVEDALASPRQEYEDLIDIDSFVDYFLLNELLRNYDVFTSSTYLWKSRGGKLCMGPPWDYDRSLGDVEFDGQWRTSGFLLTERGWAKRLLQNPNFVETYRARWGELRKGPLQTETMLALIDSFVTALGDAPDRNFEKWNVLGKYVKANRAPYAKTFKEEVTKVKGWLSARADWIDANIDEL